MKVVVIGGTGLIGSQVVADLQALGHEVVPASPRLGINSLTREGLADALTDASVVVDVSNAPSFDERVLWDFFETSTRNLIATETAAGVGHHVALSIVGTDRYDGNAWFRAKINQEKLILHSPIPFSIVHATQFFESTLRIANDSTVGNQVRIAPVRYQPIAASEVAQAVVRTATHAPINDFIEIAGPDRFRFDELIRNALARLDDRREVLADEHATWFGGKLENDTLVPRDGAVLGNMHFEDWFIRTYTPGTR